MREIKFRFWDKKHRAWEKEYSCYGIGLDRTIVRHFDNDNTIAQQYTGLKDKNGVEIYEGDIIQHFAFNEGKTFEVKWCDYEGQWIGHGAFCEWENSIIVGNIFEGVDK